MPKSCQICKIRDLAACKTLAPYQLLRASALHRRERFKYHNMTITLSLGRSDFKLVVVAVAAAALVVEPAVPRRLEAVEGPGRL